MTNNGTRTVTVELTKVLHRGQNNFCILKGTIVKSARPEAVGNLLTCVGILPQQVLGSHYEFTGQAIYSEKYQEHQLHFQSYVLNQTATLTGLQRYLVRECEHIGPGRAEQIVQAFQDRTLEVLRTGPELVAAAVVGLSVEQARTIQSWAILDQRLSTGKSKLYQAGCGPALVKKLLDNYGERVEQVLRDDAFTTTEIKGIGFLTADRIAIQFGMPAAHPSRIRAGVLYAMQETMDRKGHTCLEQQELVNAACKLLSIHKNPVIEVMKQMIADKSLVTQRDDPTPFVPDPALLDPYLSEPLPETPHAEPKPPPEPARLKHNLSFDD